MSTYRRYEFVQYFVSLGYNYDGDMFDIEEQDLYDPRTMQQRYNYRTNLNFKLTKSTKFAVKISGDVKDWQGSPATYGNGGIADKGSDALARMYTGVQLGAPYKLPDGNYAVSSVESKATNYLEAFEGSGNYENRSNRLYTDFILTQQIFEDLSASAKISYNQMRMYRSRAAMTSDVFMVMKSDRSGYEPLS